MIMTNEQTAALLGGYLSELETAVGQCDIVSDGEKNLIDLVERLRRDIATLQGDAMPVFTYGEQP